MQQEHSRELSREEILAMKHPPCICVDDITSARQTGTTVVYILNTITKTLPPEELARRRHHFAQTSWQAVHHLRTCGANI